ncbi:spondin-1 [Bombyx mori]|uniref:Spondin domain-containing protein n=1 Tax=Bombyx mori TaxID=7091 RepID=A0A8R2AI00_BOMMO|nr:spondin-1 [Bombyx mori]
MAVRHELTAILIFTIVFSYANCCDIDDVAVYKVTLATMWTEERFPKDYPLEHRPKAQWSQVFGQSHNSNYRLYRLGEVARATVREFAQFGKIDDLVNESDEEPKVYDQFSAPAIKSGEGETENMVFVDGGHSLVSLICRLIPSPDWFVGVDSLDLCVDHSWVDEVALDLEPLDAGAASGLTFTAPRWDTDPPEPISKHRPRQPNHAAAGFYYPELKELPAIAKVQFTRIKQYSTKELNNLIRKDLISILREKNLRKGLPKRIVKKDGPKDYTESTTKSNLERLTELEEEPFGTPLPGLPENHAIVVTTQGTLPTIEPEFGSELKNMDDVILAVANGKKLGLHKHLPRHFRSRLHHAVNKVQPNDCLVSEWSQWTTCSATCGYGEKIRYRTIIRKKKRGGRSCPPLTEKEHCGKVNSCFHIDYFDW